MEDAFAVDIDPSTLQFPVLCNLKTIDLISKLVQTIELLQNRREMPFLTTCTIHQTFVSSFFYRLIRGAAIFFSNAIKRGGGKVKPVPLRKSELLKKFFLWRSSDSH